MSVAGAARRGRPPMSEERRRHQRLAISREAVRLFRTQGVAATTGAQIAAAAGVSERTLWRWFRTKEACVEPLLARSIDEFTEVARSWPAGLDLTTHLGTAYGFVDDASRADIEAVLAVVRLTRDEPALRALWLVLHECAEPAFAEVLAARTGRPADGLELRVRAATTNAALRVATEDLAETARDGLTDAATARYREQLSAALRIAAADTSYISAQPSGVRPSTSVTP